MTENLTMFNSKEPTTLDQIKKFENLIDAKLPQDYINFLLKYNGGRPDRDTYKLIQPITYGVEGDINDMGAILRFLGLVDDEEEYNGLIWHYLDVTVDRIPKELIHIGYDDFGNAICLCVKGEDYGRIYFWDHEMEMGNFEISEEDWADGPWYDNVFLIADSFVEFIDKLYGEEYEDGKWIRRYSDGTVTIEDADPKDVEAMKNAEEQGRKRKEEEEKILASKDNDQRDGG